MGAFATSEDQIRTAKNLIISARGAGSLENSIADLAALYISEVGIVRPSNFAKTLVKSGGWLAPVTSGGVPLGNGWQNMNFYNMCNMSLMMQAAEVLQWRMYTINCASSPLTSFRIMAWRDVYSGSEWVKCKVYDEDFVADLKAVASAGIKTFAPKTAYIAQAGDWLGLSWTATSNPGNFLLGVTIPDWTYCGMYSTTASHTETYNPTFTSLMGNVAVPIEAYAAAPDMIGAGDSLMQAWDGVVFAGNNCNLTAPFWPPTHYDPTMSIVYCVAKKFGLSFQNRAIGGTTSTDWSSGSNLASITSSGARFCIFSLGQNDIYLDPDIPDATTELNIATICNALISTGKTPIFLAPFGLTCYTNAQCAAIDTKRAAMKIVVESYSDAIWVDIRSSINQDRSGHPGLLWDYIPANAGPDNAHMTKAGYLSAGAATASLLSSNSLFVSRAGSGLY